MAKKILLCVLLIGVLFVSGARADLILDGHRGAEYGAPIATDASGDLASPGPADWSGTLWSDLTALYAYNSADTLWIYADLGNYTNSGSTGQIGLTVDVGSAAGGTNDPWGNAITLSQANLPDYTVRGNIAGFQAGDNGWTEFRTWNGSDWNTGSGVNWGGISGGQIGTHIAYSNGAGVEFSIPFADIGLTLGDTVRLELWSTQSGPGTKGAYDSVPSDDQSNNWDDPTTMTADVAFQTVIPEPASVVMMIFGGIALMFAAIRSRKTG